jgi:hypothetical protein
LATFQKVENVLPSGALGEFEHCFVHLSLKTLAPVGYFRFIP